VGAAFREPLIFRAIAPFVRTLSPLSYSGFRTYLECPLRWKFLYVDRLPEAPRSYFSFGRSIHAALEAFVAPLVREPPARGARPGAVRQRTLWDFGEPRGSLMGLEELLALYRRSWIRDGYSSPGEERRYFELGEDLLRRFHAEFVKDPPEPVAVEKELRAEVEGLPLHGIVDRIDRHPTGGLEVVDYKTSRELSLRDATESDQLTLYQLLVEKNYDQPVEVLTLYHLRTLTPLRTARRPDLALADLSVRLGEVADGIRAEDYEPRPGPQCRSCEFRPFCPEFREPPAPEQARLGELARLYLDHRQRDSASAASVLADLSRECERLGLRRIPLGPGSPTLHVRRQAVWRFPPEGWPRISSQWPVSRGLSPPDPQELPRWRHDPRIPRELREEIGRWAWRETVWTAELER
jgi:RecB family exonuclease